MMNIVESYMMQCMHHTNLSRTEFVAIYQTNSDLQGRCRALIDENLQEIYKKKKQIID